ncbi:hypothetical protein BGC33_06100 [Bathymodiolus thermophilus thioautotrophic gill symbiont]|uniref:Uncharacterized protein n=3 Tax=Bathymodiolus thermophilus thioautotrophic gill symbiont TaxID=2360 RepID=A0A1J5TWT3_9GAMM|nr:hypothetical protein BGC33_06100 [Bathymodiolus thermophilus thioautotrophic gill symbiont]
MSTYHLSPKLKKFFHLCYRSTFYLFLFYFIFFLVFIGIMFTIATSRADLKAMESNQMLLGVTYVYSIFLLFCIVSMAFYAFGYLWQLWQENQKKEALKGLVIFMFMTMGTGYIWFYYSEIKKRKIRMKFPPYPKELKKDVTNQPFKPQTKNPKKIQRM